MPTLSTTVRGIVRRGSRDSSASGPEFSQPTYANTARPNVRPPIPAKPPGDPPIEWNGVAIAPCAWIRITMANTTRITASDANSVNAALTETPVPRSNTGTVMAIAPNVIQIQVPGDQFA